MSPIVAYILGILTVIVILVPFWYFATVSNSINNFYRNSVCYGICGYTGTGGAVPPI